MVFADDQFSCSGHPAFAPDHRLILKSNDGSFNGITKIDSRAAMSCLYIRELVGPVGDRERQPPKSHLPLVSLAR